jgi:hypothetical protein
MTENGNIRLGLPNGIFCLNVRTMGKSTETGSPYEELASKYVANKKV